MSSNSSIRTAVLHLALLTASVFAAGCKDTGPKNAEFFAPQETQSVVTALDCQAVNGARHDAMLREQHFDGARLNALGRWKLDQMLAQPGPVTVYLPETSDKDQSASRRQAIVAYAKDSGRSEADLKMIDGINPATVHPAAPGLARLNKTESGKGDDQGSTPADATGNSDGLGLSGNNSPGSMGSTAKSGG